MICHLFFQMYCNIHSPTNLWSLCNILPASYLPILITMQWSVALRSAFYGGWKKWHIWGVLSLNHMFIRDDLFGCDPNGSWFPVCIGGGSVAWLVDCIKVRTLLTDCVAHRPHLPIACIPRDYSIYLIIV